MKKLFTIIVLLSFSLLAFSQKEQQDSVAVAIEFVHKVKKDTKKAENEAAIVKYDVIKDGKVVIAAGTPVLLDIQSEKRRGVGKPGSLTVKPVYTTNVNGQVLALNGNSKQDIGKNRKNAAVACGVVFGIIAFPVGLLFLCIKGGRASFAAGTQMVATCPLN